MAAGYTSISLPGAITGSSSMPTTRSSGDTPRGFRDWSPPSLATSSRRFSFRCSSRSPQQIRIRPPPGSNYDQLFIATAEYDDGFAKIVHCRQPTNRDLLEEKSDGSYPVKDVGVNLGWDDEEITDRYIRQLEIDPAGGMDGRLDAPLGVFGYVIDVRETAEPENPWESLNLVQSRQALTLAGACRCDRRWVDSPASCRIRFIPMQVDGRKNLNYWLPMYFANWMGHSMVLPDPDAAAIYQTTNVDVTADPVDAANDTGTGVSGPAQNQLNAIYAPGAINTQLRYGRNYEFRVRMQDLSGGAPDIVRGPINETASDTTSCRFRRFISPNQPRILEMQASGNDDSVLVNSDSPAAIAELNIQRPKLGYPAVVFTGKYNDPRAAADRSGEPGPSGRRPRSQPECGA